MSKIADNQNSTSSFIVKNITTNKAIKIFNVKLGPGRQMDLMMIPGITEEDVRSSLSKGDLGRKAAVGQITVVSTTIDLITFSSTQSTLLTSVGVSTNNFAPPSTKSFSAPNLTSLAAVDSSLMVNGTLAFIASLDDFFKLDSTSTLTADAITVIAAAAGGRWIRCFIKSTKWANQANWYVDSVAGVDESDGSTSGTALKTFAELVRRLSLYPVFSQRTDVFILNNLAVTDPMIWRPAFDLNGVLYIHGTLTPVVSGTGTFTAKTNRVASTNTPCQVTDTTRTSWTGNINQMLMVTAGTAGTIGAIAWPFFDLGSNAVRLSPLALTDVIGTVSPLPSEKNPTIGDAYTLYTMTNVAYASIEVYGANSTVANKGRVIIEYLRFNGTNTSEFKTYHGSHLILHACVAAMTCSVENGVRALNCFGENGGRWGISGGSPGLFATFTAGATVQLLSLNVSGWGSLTGGFTFQGQGSICAIVSSGGFLTISDLMCFDWGTGTREAILVGSNGTLNSQGGPWSGSSSVSAAHVLSVGNGRFICTNPAVITIRNGGGVAYDFLIQAQSSGPAYDTVTNAFVGNRAYTFALLSTAVGGVGGTGFSNNAVNPANGTGIVFEQD